MTDRILDEIPAKNIVYTPYMYMVLANPTQGTYCDTGAMHHKWARKERGSWHKMRQLIQSHVRWRMRCTDGVTRISMVSL